MARNVLPRAAGIGYKPQHFTELMDHSGPFRWLEIHAENYMGDGGRPHAQLAALAARFPVSVHGVGLSIGGEDPLDKAHLARLRSLCDRIKPAAFSEHLAWSTHDGAYLNDLLPLPYTPATLSRTADHIAQVQDTLGRPMLLENPSSYFVLPDSTIPEPELLRMLTERTGCGLLMDVNNLFITAANTGVDSHDYLEALPLDRIGEVHIAGHSRDAAGDLLIDDHGSPAAEPVWQLLDHLLSRTGPLPVLVEWDNDVPDFVTLAAEAALATRALRHAQRIAA